MDDVVGVRVYLPGHDGNLCGGSALCRGRAGEVIQGRLSWFAVTLILGVLFGLFVAFTAAQVWTDNEKARAEIDREASALRNVVILASAFPKESEVQLRELMRRYIADAANQEWPMMAQGKANL